MVANFNEMTKIYDKINNIINRDRKFCFIYKTNIEGEDVRIFGTVSKCRKNLTYYMRIEATIGSRPVFQRSIQIDRINTIFVKDEIRDINIKEFKKNCGVSLYLNDYDHEDTVKNLLFFDKNNYIMDMIVSIYTIHNTDSKVPLYPDVLYDYDLKNECIKYNIH